MEIPAPPSASGKSFDLVAYLKLFRFPLVFTAIADSWAGYFLGSGLGERFKAWTLVSLGLCSACLYSFGMAMNDIADRERDSTLAPTRPLPSGRITLRNAVMACGMLLIVSAAAILLAAGTNFQAYQFWGLTVLGIVTYDFWIKIPPVMGFIRVCNLFLGMSAADAIDWDESWVFLLAFASPHFLYVTALTYVSTLEDTELKRARLWTGTGIMVLALLLAANWFRTSLGAAFSQWGEGWRKLEILINAHKISRIEEVPALGIAVLLSAWLVFRASRARDRKGVMLLVRDGVAGIILLNATLLLVWTPPWSSGLILLALIVPAILSLAIFKHLA